MDTMHKIIFSIIISAIICYSQTIKLASLAPSGSPWDDGLKSIAAEWKKVSNGSIIVKVYPGGIAGDEADVIRKMRIGQIQAAGITGVGLCRIYNGVLAVQLPLTVRTNEELSYVLEKITPFYEKELAAQKFKVIFWMPVGWVHFFAKNPVIKPEDLQKQKFFVWAGDADGVQTWKEAGFHPIPLAVTDLMSSLQSGMVDAFSTTPLSAASYQWFGLAKNMCGMKWAPLIGGLVITTTAWDAIPANLKPQLVEAAEKIGRSLQTESLKADDQAIEVMKKYGLTVNPVSDADIAAWQKIAQEGIQKVSGKSFDAKSYEQVIKLLGEFRAIKK
jgi:TRAP-type transport system periplasmic protein